MYKLIAILALLGGLLGLHYYAQGVAVDNAIELTTGRLNKEWQNKMDVAAAKKDKAQQDLSDSHYEEVKKKDEHLKNMERKHAALVSSLSNRPSRNSPSPVTPSGTTIGQTCTGAQLYREDGEFLAGEAARADGIVIERDYYYQEYENLRIILEQLRK